MTCESALELLFDFLDGELEDATHEQVAEHLAVCLDCYPYFNFQRLFLDRLAVAAETGKPSLALTRRIKELLSREPLR
jgi:predicted anti-sigma-YlaC factor YlaD